MAAMCAKATRQLDQLVARARVDEVGHGLVSGSPAAYGHPQGVHRHAFGQETLAYAERLQSQGGTVAELGDPNLAAVQGGLMVRPPSRGAIMEGDWHQWRILLGFQAVGISRRLQVHDRHGWLLEGHPSERTPVPVVVWMCRVHGA